MLNLPIVVSFYCKKRLKLINICIFTIKSCNRAHWGQLAQWAWKSARPLTALIKQLLRVIFINKVVSQLMTVKGTSVFRDSHCPCSWRQTHHHKHDNQAAAEVESAVEFSCTLAIKWARLLRETERVSSLLSVKQTDVLSGYPIIVTRRQWQKLCWWLHIFSLKTVCVYPCGRIMNII